jgi:glycosyltransferase involved in cell wall biosynthesis
MARVSVVTIFRNAGAFIGETIDSVLGQTYADWELVLVDDGSTDDSTAIARAACAQHPDRIRYCAHPGRANLGMSRSRNRGASLASGEFITFLDADDVWPSSKLAEQVSVMDTVPAASMTYGRGLAWYSWMPRARQDDHGWTLGVTPDSLVPPPTLFCMLLENKAQTPMSGNALLRRAAFDAVGGYEDAFTGMYEDAALFAKIHLRYSTYVSGRTWLKYRQHVDSETATHSNRNYAITRRPFIDWLATYLDRPDIDVPAEARATFRVEYQRCHHSLSHQVLEFVRDLASGRPS